LRRGQVREWPYGYIAEYKEQYNENDQTVSEPRLKDKAFQVFFLVENIYPYGHIIEICEKRGGYNEKEVIPQGLHKIPMQQKVYRALASAAGTFQTGKLFEGTKAVVDIIHVIYIIIDENNSYRQHDR